MYPFSTFGFPVKTWEVRTKMTPGGVIRDIFCGSGKFYKRYFNHYADESIIDADDLMSE